MGLVRLPLEPLDPPQHHLGYREAPSGATHCPVQLRLALTSLPDRAGARRRQLEAVRELAGHSKLQTTQCYPHTPRADLRDAVSWLPGNDAVAKPVRNGPR